MTACRSRSTRSSSRATSCTSSMPAVRAAMPRDGADTLPKHVAMKVGPYEVQGYLHGLPGADPIAAIRRRKSMMPLTDARIEYVDRWRASSRTTSTTVDPQPRTDRMGRRIVDARPGRCSPPGPARSRHGDDEDALGASERPRRPGATIGRRCPTDPTSSPPARSPDSASSTARRSWPGRTARCSSATWAPTSSRSSHRRATRPAAGDRPGSGRSKRGRGPPPTSWRSIGTSAASASTSRPPDGAGVLRRLLARRRRPGRELPGRRRSPGSASTTTRCARINPRLVHLAISGYGPNGPGRGPARLRLRHPGRRAGSCRSPAPPTRTAASPTKVGVAISDVVTGMLGAVGVLAALLGRERDGRPGAGAGQRIDVSIARSDAGEPREPGTERVRVGRARPGGSATPTRTSCRTRRSRRPTARSRSRSGRSASGRGCARRSGCPDWPTIRASRPTATASSTASELRPILAERASSTRTTADWLAALDAAEIPCGPINDVLDAFASPEAVALGMSVEQEHPAFGVDPPGRAPVPAVSATPASIRTPPPTTRRRTPTRSSPSSATRPAEIAGLRARGVV